MNLTLREAARFLDMSERELLRLARDGALPACRIHDEYLFNPVELQEWAAKSHHKLAHDFAPALDAAERAPSVAAAIERGGVHYDLPGTSRDDVLERVAELAEVPAHVDRALLAEVLRTREMLGSTGVGGGIAIPHPREPVVLHIAEPVIVLCFLTPPVDFDAIDGKPVGVLFALLSPTIALHLKMLSRLAYALHDEELRLLLDRRAGMDAILARIETLEAAMDSAHATGTDT